MSTRPNASPAAAFADEFGSFLEQSKEDPGFRASYEDAEELHRVLDSLVQLRKALRLSQTTVAERMGVRQPTVSGFETEASDPRLSTLQRYARAVDARIRLVVDMPADCDWVLQRYDGGQVMAEAKTTVHTGALARNWREADSRPDRWMRAA